MSDDKSEPTQTTQLSGTLHPDTHKNISSMADAFKSAMGNQTQPKPEPKAAPEPEPEPAAAADEPVDTVQDSDESSESRSARDFKRLKQERDEAKARVAELLSQVSSFEDNASAAEKLAALQSEYDEMSQTLSLTNLERHPKFREQYVKPIDTQIDRAKAYVPEGDRASLEKILRMPVSEGRAEALDELVGDLPASRQAYLQTIVNRIDEIAYERDQQISNSRSSYERLVEQESEASAQKTQERNQALDKSFQRMLKEAQESIPVFQLREGDEEWNTGVRERVNLAKKILTEQNSFEDAATAALWAASGGVLVEQNAALVEHNRRLTAELKQLKGAEPSAASKSTTSGQPRSLNSPSGNSFSERVLSALRT